MPSVNYLDTTKLWGGEARTTYGGTASKPYSVGADLGDPTIPFGCFSKVALDKPRAFILSVMTGTAKITGYFGVTDDPVIGASLHIPYDGDSSCYGVGGGQTGGDSINRWYRDYPDGREIMDEGFFSPAYIGTEVSVYIDPDEGKCWICKGGDGYDADAEFTAYNDIDDGWCFPDGGDPINQTDPTFTFPTTGSWYLDIRSSDNESDCGDSYANEIAVVLDPEYSTVYSAWSSYSGYTLGWNEVIDDLGAAAGITAPIMPVILESINNIQVGTGLLGPWYYQELDDMTDIGSGIGISLPFGYPYVSDPDSIAISLMLKAFSLQARFGMQGEFSFKPLSISSIVTKSTKANIAMSLKSLRVQADIGIDRLADVSMEFKGFKINCKMTTDELINGSLTLQSLSMGSLVYEIARADTEFTLSAFELKAVGLQSLDHFVMRYTR